MIVHQSPQKALLRPCKVAKVGELGVDYETAFYAVSEAYMNTSELVAKCNLRLETAIQQIEKQEALHDRSKDNSGF